MLYSINLFYLILNNKSAVGIKDVQLNFIIIDTWLLQIIAKLMQIFAFLCKKNYKIWKILSKDYKNSSKSFKISKSVQNSNNLQKLELLLFKKYLKN